MIEKIKGYDNKELSKIWCYLNQWKFPKFLNEYKPKNWELLPIQFKSQYLQKPIDYIKSRVPHKDLLREWNKERLVGVEFDIWWENNQDSNSNSEKKALIQLFQKEYANMN